MELRCKYCGNDLEDISAMHWNQTKIYRCNNEKCICETNFFDKNLDYLKCSVGGELLFKVDHLIPDVYIEGKWICRNHAFGIILRGE